MVHADRTVPSIRAALVRGDFYSTTAIRLASASVRRGALTVEVQHDGGDNSYEIVFVGTGGRTFQTSRSTSASFDLAAAPVGYVRALVTDRRGRRAWVQPVRTA